MRNDIPIADRAEVLMASAKELADEIDLGDLADMSKAVAVAHLYDHAATIAVRALRKCEKEKTEALAAINRPQLGITP